MSGALENDIDDEYNLEIVHVEGLNAFGIFSLRSRGGLTCRFYIKPLCLLSDIEDGDEWQHVVNWILEIESAAVFTTDAWECPVTPKVYWVLPQARS